MVKQFITPRVKLENTVPGRVIFMLVAQICVPIVIVKREYLQKLWGWIMLS